MWIVNNIIAASIVTFKLVDKRICRHRLMHTHDDARRDSITALWEFSSCLFHPFLLNTSGGPSCLVITSLAPSSKVSAGSPPKGATILAKALMMSSGMVWHEGLRSVYCFLNRDEYGSVVRFGHHRAFCVLWPNPTNMGQGTWEFLRTVLRVHKGFANSWRATPIKLIRQRFCIPFLLGF